MDNAITLTLQGPANQMMMLFNSTSNLDNTVLYVVNNASCYIEAIEAIAIKEYMAQSQVDDMVCQQNGKTFKKAFLKSQGYKRLSALNLSKLDNLILQHFGQESL